jgi:SAM-dependent methyltransferase
MNHADHVNLIRDGIPHQEPGSSPPIWADLGSGRGAFTLALAELLPPGGVIYSVDRDAAALREQERAMRVRFPRSDVRYVPGDFTHPLDLPPLDGLLMANSLHFHQNKELIIRTVKSYLKPGGRIILVEYSADRGNFWVPHPLSFPTWKKLASRCGFSESQLLATYPSRFLAQIYAALSWFE